MITKDRLTKLYADNSLEQIAAMTGLAKSTLYYYMRKYGIPRRSKGDAQKKHLQDKPHQRRGVMHSEATKIQIAKSTKKYWESDKGTAQKNRLKTLRQTDWRKKSPKEKKDVLRKLQFAPKPEAGELSNFGKALFAYLSKVTNVRSGLALTSSHISDIILDDHKIVLELILPIEVFGQDQKDKMMTRYDRLTQELNDAGYRVIIIEDGSSSVSRARCQRVYDQILDFIKTDKKSIYIKS